MFYKKAGDLQVGDKIFWANKKGDPAELTITYKTNSASRFGLNQEYAQDEVFLKVANNNGPWQGEIRLPSEVFVGTGEATKGRTLSGARGSSDAFLVLADAFEDAGLHGVAGAARALSTDEPTLWVVLGGYTTPRTQPDACWPVACYLSRDDAETHAQNATVVFNLLWEAAQLDNRMLWEMQEWMEDAPVSRTNEWDPYMHVVNSVIEYGVRAISVFEAPDKVSQTFKARAVTNARMFAKLRAAVNQRSNTSTTRGERVT